MSRAKSIPACGDIEIIEGVMGTGKTLYATKLITDIVQQELRPVFTNTPFRWPVFRKYLALKFGKEAASLVFPLTREHLMRFIDRQSQAADIREEMRLTANAQGLPFSNAAADKAIVERLGEPVHSGPQANDILAGAYLILDEVQNWFAMQNQGGEDSKKLQRYLTMCRHHWHQVIVITQNASNVDVVFRKLVRLYHIARKKDEDRLIFGLRYKALGLKVVGWAKYTREQVEGKANDLAGATPLSQSVLFLNLPWERWRFRLYSSFTHMGSPRKMRATLQKTRQDLGVQRIADERDEREAQHAKGRPMRIGKFVSGLAVKAAVLAAGCAVGLGVSAFNQQKQEAIELAQAEEEAAAVVAVIPGVLQMVTSSKAVVDGVMYEVGDRIGNAEIIEIDRERRGVVLSAPDGLHAWYAGERPRHVGTVDEVRDRSQQAIAAANGGIFVGGGGQGRVPFLPADQFGGSRPDAVADARADGGG